MSCNGIPDSFFIVPPSDVNDDVLTSSTVPENDEAEWDSGTNYSLGALVMVTDPGIHKIYECAKTPNTNNYPPDNLTGTTPYWIKISPTNRWAMFDGTTGYTTEYANDIEVVLQMDSGVTNAIVLFGLDGDSVTVSCDNGSGVVYSKTIDIKYRTVTGWYSFFFDPFIQLDRMFLMDLPAYLNMEITITITADSGGAACSQCVVGRFYAMGGTERGSRILLDDLSIKSVDEFGVWNLVQRASRDTIDYQVKAEEDTVLRAKNLLDQYRATPIAWIGGDANNLTTIWGIRRDAEIEFNGPIISSMKINVEELK